MVDVDQSGSLRNRPTGGEGARGVGTQCVYPLTWLADPGEVVAVKAVSIVMRGEVCDQF